jgi:WD40 repeat protein
MGLSDDAAVPDPTIASREQAQRLKVFVSYARVDSTFADRLVAALEAAGLDVLIDRRDLPLLEEWQRELLGFIRQADAVVFVISPASLQSKWCEWEVSQVTELRKRLAPILAQPVVGLRLPEAVEKINFIDFTDADRFDDGARKLASALQLDLPWIKEHTRLADRSRLWLERDRANALLLRGIELEQAERWLLSAPRAAPTSSAQMPTAGHRVFIQESRQAEQARAQDERMQLEKTRRFQRRAGFALGGVAVLLVAAAIATLWQVRETNRKESILLAGRAAQWSDKGHCDQAMRFALLALPPERALPLLWTWTAEAEAQLMRAAWGCPLLSRIALPQGGISSAALAPDGRTLLITGKDGIARLVDEATGQEIGRFAGHATGIEWGAFSPDGGRAVTAGWDGVAIVWEVATKREIARLTGHSQTIFTAVFAPDGETIVTASDDGLAMVWDAKSGELLARLAGHAGGATSASYSPDGSLIVTGGKDNVARIWDAASHRELRVLKGHTNWVTFVAFDPNGHRIVTAGHDNTARVWNAQNADEILVLKGHTDVLHAAAFSPDGRTIATGSADTSIRLWDAQAGARTGQIDGHTGAIWTVVFGAGGARLISASEDRTLRTASVSDIRTPHVLLDGDTGVTHAQFSGNGTEMVGPTSDGVVRAWDASSGVEKRASDGPLNVPAISPDGALAAVLDRRAGRSVVELVDWSTGRRISLLQLDGGDVSAVRFDHGGGRIVVVNADGTLRVFDVATGRPVSPSCGMIRRGV